MRRALILLLLLVIGITLPNTSFGQVAKVISMVEGEWWGSMTGPLLSYLSC